MGKGRGKVCTRWVKAGVEYVLGRGKVRGRVCTSMYILGG